MLKTFLLFSAAILLGTAQAPSPAPVQGNLPQETAPEHTAAITNPVKPTAASQERARKTYQIDCAMCHGDNGNGKTDLGRDMQLALPDWTKPAELAGKPDQALFSTIRNGKDKMPAEAEGRASDNDVWNLIIYIRAMSKGQ